MGEMGGKKKEDFFDKTMANEWMKACLQLKGDEIHSVINEGLKFLEEEADMLAMRAEEGRTQLKMLRNYAEKIQPEGKEPPAKKHKPELKKDHIVVSAEGGSTIAQRYFRKDEEDDNYVLCLCCEKKDGSPTRLLYKNKGNSGVLKHIDSHLEDWANCKVSGMSRHFALREQTDAEKKSWALWISKNKRPFQITEDPELREYMELYHHVKVIHKDAVAAIVKSKAECIFEKNKMMIQKMVHMYLNSFFMFCYL